MLKPRKNSKPTTASKAVKGDAALADKKQAAQRHIEAVKKSQAEKSKANAECGPIPPPADSDRRESCRLNLQRFAETYLITMFQNKQGLHRPWAPFHIECFRRLQETILNGGELGEALPRGSAKTSMTMGAVIWAACYGHCKFAAVICASDPLATQYLENVKTQFEVQQLLLADFPEVCIPIRHLERKTQKCKTQTVDAIQTRIEWNQEFIVLPTVAGSAASGFRFQTAGLTGSGIRGLLAANASGQLVRPDVVILDDVQTDDSARSVLQCDTRLRLIDAVMGMAGPGEKFSMFACVTVIREGDVADTILNDPDWQAIREGILNQMPSKSQLVWWAQYRDIQIDSKNRRLGLDPELNFYRENKAAIEGDLKPTWPDRYKPDQELSGIHHAINLYYKFGSDSFAAEFMNRPKSLDESQIYRLDPQAVRERLNGLPRGVVPLGYDFITIGVDIQKPILFYVVMAWKKDLTGAIIDYGYVPKQRRREFNLNDLEFTLQSQSGAIDADIDAAVSWGLVEFGKYLDQAQWANEQGLQIFPVKAQIDINYAESQSAVGRFCRTSKWKHIFAPARGQAMTTTKKIISSWRDQPGQIWPERRERRDCEWMETNPKTHGCREVYFDANHWKNHIHTALSLPLHASGSISIFGEDPNEHHQLASHLTSNYPKEITIDGVSQNQWLKRPELRDDLLDCVSGCAVSASRYGARLSRATTALPAINEPSDRRIINIPAHRIVRGASL